jgi:large-conductance mechanosensitive channel
MPKDLVKGIGIDASMVGAFVLSLLPFIQTLIGIAIAIVILLINIKRLKKMKREEQKEQEKN